MSKINGKQVWRQNLKKNKWVQIYFDKNCEENSYGKEWRIASQNVMVDL